MKQTLKDYDVNMKNVPLYCDNESAIKIAHNPVQYSEPRGALMCGSSIITILADSGPFRAQLLTILGSQSDFHGC